MARGRGGGHLARRAPRGVPRLTPNDPHLPETLGDKIKDRVIGPARDVRDPHLTKHISLVAILAWVGLGADGLSSSAYGPEEAYRALGAHTYLAFLLVLATAATVAIISYTYTKIIEHFPMGGGGYIVATKLLGKNWGVVSGSALLVDYILTITVSIAAGGDAVFSLLPLSLHAWRLPTEFAAIGVLILLNLRGVKESVTALLPIFAVFLATHVLLIGGGIYLHLGHAATLLSETRAGMSAGAAEIGVGGLVLLFLRAYSLGGGTYTGIEAVSNGLAVLREPRVRTAKRTMFYMAMSLALTAGGLLLCYMLADVHPAPGQTLNAVLAQDVTRSLGGLGAAFVIVTILSESVLLMVAAQTGFIDGPRVMANMAGDGWLPRKFAALSDRLASQNGILLMGLSAVALLAYTQGHIGLLVVMYAVNVFVTFTLSQMGMMRFWWGESEHGIGARAWNLLLHGVGFVLCGGILGVMVFEKFREGAWVTVVVTSVVIGIAFAIRNHYREVASQIRAIDRNTDDLEIPQGAAPPAFDPKQPTAVLLVSGYGRLGIHSLLTVLKLFPCTFSNVVFVSVGVVNSAFLSEGDEIAALEERTRATLARYVELANRIGLPARFAYSVGADVVEEVATVCLEVSKAHPGAVFFAGEILFEDPKWWHRVLHNETAYAIQREIRHAGLPLVILPILISEAEA